MHGRILARQYVFVGLAVGALIAVGGCSRSEDDKRHAEPAPPTPATSEHATAPKTEQPAAPAAAPHWSYDGDSAPHLWGKLNSEFATCASGKQQSPIDITAVTVTEELSPPQTSYQPTPLKILNNGHTIQVNYAPGSTLTVGAESYELVQYHFHTPSEHTLGGKAYELVAHFVHRSAAGKLAVIAVLFREGAKNAALEPIWAHLPTKAGEEVAVPNGMTNAADFLPATKSYFGYSGSLTTPPCSEGVQWLVMNNAVDASSEQLAQFRGLFAHNARPVQPLNGRTIRFSGS